ncbi:L-rhamnose mutarotase, partial [Yersinia intermedia]|uniref:L-rhamnose mutarotase n=1 Tax=Yersinia intermedia TaxID=631 RepID=UPI0011A241DD
MAIVRRFGCIVKVRPEKLDYYKQLHANPWPEVNAMIKVGYVLFLSIYFYNGLLF